MERIVKGLVYMYNNIIYVIIIRRPLLLFDGVTCIPYATYITHTGAYNIIYNIQPTIINNRQ